ncbi:RNA polymerase sigma-70 factor (ECF subfamily) [Ulvibacter antarcticus]|uniref:RNA polymerase sigma-70 factor (ECF subfamily) n=2 Tax=Ulvibacter antarcticus TaxID=442714 RepID=A0A3L9YVV5_9FLAO|nr:RNA polymerase sigma-70 factor (ECF subfamily) [Ulvibacter antarcticus]
MFEVLYDRYCHVVYNKCFSFVNNEDEAKDLSQDVFLKLFIKLDSFQGRSKFSTWLYAFTYNLCANYVTRSTAKKIEKKSVPVEEYDHLLIEIDDYNLFQIQVNKLKKALEIIPNEDRMILLLKYQDDLSIKELSSILEIGESAVKMRLKRAKARVVELCNEKM